MEHGRMGFNAVISSVLGGCCAGEATSAEELSTVGAHTELLGKTSRATGFAVFASAVAPPFCDEVDCPGFERVVVVEDDQSDFEVDCAENSNLSVQKFDLVIDRSGSNLPCGWHVDALASGALYITSIDAPPRTLVAAYNATAPAGQRIRERDYIVAVNGESRDTAVMIDSLQEAPLLEVTIQRPSSFRTRCDKSLGERQLGIELKYSPLSRSLVIQGFRGKSSSKLLPDLKLNDRIVRVNGNTGSSKQLIQVMQDSERLELAVLRLPGGSGAP